ncbi:DUF296 domain-containing protein [Vibrio sp. IRLE0018]|uniref:PPC domain-containing DNA-binding protein n=1 Tax=Vibrio TaxID=662 RepID=UPI001594AEE6|nr:MULTISPECIES: PPC domain-containing DNA-binding protein [Vibrio]MCF8779137.1 DUF296 domain-containing protein [Vibrio floridensis]NVC63020.1 DUF296 domain-containing protein [Vibrio sp. 05-20-BW147]HAS6347220.1 DUF296 domain-containing protein [Vibrio vulnificus]
MTINVIVERLTRGCDLKTSIADIVKKHQISAGSIAGCTGCLERINLRLAGAQNTLCVSEPFEIVSITATLTPEHQHIHISVADKQGRVYGGHLLEGSFVDTTAELIIHSYPDMLFQRVWDDNTGFSELSNAM